MAKRIEKLIVALSVVALVVVLLVGIVAPLFNKVEAEVIPFAPEARPEGEKLDLTMPDASDKEATIAFAVALYEIASEKYCTIDNVAYMVQYANKMMADVNGQRYSVRNGDKEYYTEFAFVQKEEGISMGSIMGAVSANSTRFAEARYTDSTMDYTQSIKMYSSSDKLAPSFVLNENGTYDYNVLWGEKTTEITELAKHDYGYRLTDQDITLETVTDATVEYNAEEGYYTLVLTLDPQKASEAITIHNLKSNVADAEYTSMVQTIEIWDNGLPRFFHAVDKWEGTMVISLNAELIFDTTYYYGEQYTNIENYQYMKELCTLDYDMEAALELNKKAENE